MLVGGIVSGTQGRAFYDLEIYQRYEKLSDLLWDEVDRWEYRHQQHPGNQMLRAVDSIGANIAESIGRGHYKEGQQFLNYARGSVTETQHWIRRAVKRGLIQKQNLSDLRSTSIILHKQLNAFKRAQKPLAPAKSQELRAKSQPA